MPLQISFPESLPVSARRDEIMAAMAEHQVIIVCGETGSGKTTQLPKIALALGRGRCNAKEGERGRLIGHIQPRRIAATLPQPFANHNFLLIAATQCAHCDFGAGWLQANFFYYFFAVSCFFRL